VTVPRKDETTYGLKVGLAPVGVDVKGAPAPLPCRVKVVWDKKADNVAMVRRMADSSETECLKLCIRLVRPAAQWALLFS
jgi:hypothetical protein